MNRAVFLDRDGVLNEAVVREGKPYPPASPEEMTIDRGIKPFLDALRDVGFLLICVTNQPDVARGSVQKVIVEAMHQKLLNMLPLDGIEVCYHDDRDGCSCRKPRPGMILSAAGKYEINLSDSYMIGDRWRDIEAGQQAGCRTVWVKHPYKERGPEQPPDFVTDSAQGALKWVLDQPGRQDDAEFKNQVICRRC